MPPLGVQPVSWLVVALALLSAYRLASAQQEDSNLCSCTDLLWKPEPSHAWEVVNWHSKLVAELNAAEAKGGFDVLFYGDSITMRWRDDWPANEWGVGPPPANFPGETPMGIFNQTFRTNFTSDILGIGSDTTANLWWRVKNGELPVMTPPKLAVVMVGTNDLGYTEACFRNGDEVTEAANGTISRMRHIFAYMRRNAPRMQILIVGILPRGAWSLPDPFAWPNRLTEAINTVNNASQALPKEDPMIHYIDCGPDFINAANHSLNATLLPEYLHPSTAGYRVLADCLKPVVDNLVLGPQPRWNVTAPLMDVRDNYTNTCADYKGAQYTTMSASVSPKLIPKPATQSTSSNSLYSSLDTTTGDR